jgi:serine/threonine-protein kinase
LFWQLADGSESPQPLTTGERLHFAGPWHPDGSEILIYDVSDADILALTIPPSEGKPRPVLAEPAASAYPALSPDGRWLAYASDESGRFEVYVRPYPSLEGKQQVSRNGGVMPVWSRSGDELFYVLLRSSQREREAMMAVEMSSGAGTPRELFQGQFVVGVFLATYDVARDGRFLMGVPSEAPEAAHTSVRLVLNWFEELERLVPTN